MRTAEKNSVQNGQFRGWAESSTGQLIWKSFPSPHLKPYYLTCSLSGRDEAVAAGLDDRLVMVPSRRPWTCQVLDYHIEEAFLRHSRIYKVRRWMQDSTSQMPLKWLSRSTFHGLCESNGNKGRYFHTSAELSLWISTPVLYPSTFWSTRAHE
jgi:hypothetical protein